MSGPFSVTCRWLPGARAESLYPLGVITNAWYNSAYLLTAVVLGFAASFVLEGAAPGGGDSSFRFLLSWCLWRTSACSLPMPSMPVSRSLLSSLW